MAVVVAARGPTRTAADSGRGHRVTEGERRGLARIPTKDVMRVAMAGVEKALGVLRQVDSDVVKKALKVENLGVGSLRAEAEDTVEHLDVEMRVALVAVVLVVMAAEDTDVQMKASEVKGEVIVVKAGLGPETMRRLVLNA